MNLPFKDTIDRMLAKPPVLSAIGLVGTVIDSASSLRSRLVRRAWGIFGSLPGKMHRAYQSRSSLSPFSSK